MSSSPQAPTFRLRPARFSDAPSMTTVATAAYRQTALSEFLAPHRFRYWSDWCRGTLQRNQLRIFTPGAICFVACPSSCLSQVVAHACFQRHGSRVPQLPLLDSLARFFWLAIHNIQNWMQPDRSLDKENWRRFIEVVETDNKRVWGRKEFNERWHVVSCTVHPDWQRRGIGKALMMEVMKLAEEEKVPVTLEASPEGEKLYESLGFEMVSEFSLKIEQEGGGMMAWWPEGLKVE